MPTNHGKNHPIHAGTTATFYYEKSSRNNQSVGKSMKNFTTILVFLLLTACGGFKELQNAQDHFSKAATIELQNQFDPQNITFVDPDNWYQLAYSNVKKALQNTPSLERDSLLGMAYSLKALCEWKLQKYQLAEISRKAALNRIKTPNRNYALMTALPDLIKIDATTTALKQTFLRIDPKGEQIILFFQTYFPEGSQWKHIKNAILQTQEEKASIIYLYQTQLSGLKVWSDALDGLKQYMDAGNSYPAILREIFANQYQQYLKEKAMAMDFLRQDPSLVELFNYWNTILL